jgi:hypothetical protein
MAASCVWGVALLVLIQNGTCDGADQASYQQLVAVQVSMTGTSMAPSTSSRQQPEKTGRMHARFGGLSVNHGIGCALVNDAAAAAAGALVIHDTLCEAATRFARQPLAQRVEAVNGVHRLGVGIGISSALVHAERVAAAGSAGQRDDHTRHMHVLDVLRAVQRLLDASSKEHAESSRFTEAQAACLADLASTASSELDTTAASSEPSTAAASSEPSTKKRL